MSVIRTAMAALLSLTVVGATLTGAEAGQRERDFARGVATGVAGAVIVGGLAQSNRANVSVGTGFGYGHGFGYNVPSYRYADPVVTYRPRVVYERPVIVERPVVYERPVRSVSSYDAHVSYCYGRYRSYRESDNTFQPYHGPRRQCRSPY